MLLAFGTWPFYTVFLISFLIMIACVECENSLGAFATLFVGAILILSFGNKDLGPWIIHHPLKMVEYICGYLAFGILWGTIKWFLFVLKARDRYETIRTNFIAKYQEISDKPLNNKTTETFRQRFMLKIHDNNAKQPIASKNKGRIIFWMSYWPASATWTIINDPITRIYRFLFARVVKVFEGISNSLFAKYKTDLEG